MWADIKQKVSGLIRVIVSDWFLCCLYALKMCVCVMEILIITLSLWLLIFNFRKCDRTNEKETEIFKIRIFIFESLSFSLSLSLFSSLPLSMCFFSVCFTSSSNWGSSPLNKYKHFPLQGQTMLLLIRNVHVRTCVCFLKWNFYIFNLFYNPVAYSLYWLSIS